MSGLRMLSLWTLAGCVIAVIAGWAPLSDWLKTHAELAAWVQAVGSVAAIIATGIYVQWQHQLEVERKGIEDLQARRRRLEVIVELSRATKSSVRWVQQQLMDRETVHDTAEGRLYLDRRVVAELGTLLSAIPLHELEDPTVANEVLSLLHSARKMSGLVDDLLRLHRVLDAQMFENAFIALAQAADACEVHYVNLRQRVDLVAPK
ncbi:hypothetical protein [Variovorax sp. AFSI2.2]|uniref:hypothetical protein n=1 Tax=Variovorax sp. AFSI2.2 TaxID=3384160 RepID=UPI003EBDAC73